MNLDFLDLKGKMDRWGPFTGTLGTLIFSIGNMNEGHGPALSPDNDSRCANFVANRVAEITGARFIAHIPYTTDRVGDIAKDWSPGYIPMDECVVKSVEFVKSYCQDIREAGINFEKILIIVGHGGNNGIEKYTEWNEIKDEFDLTSIIFSSTFNIDLGEILRLLEPFSEETRMLYLGIRPGHADTMEHSIAVLYNGVDFGKLHIINEFIKKNGVDAALKKWPVLGGLGGYLKFGGPRYEPLKRISGLKACLKKFEEDAAIFIYPEFAKLVMESSIRNIAKK
ncbi:MAG: hypothetical protein ACTSXP_04660, partial [Promethearchaeota archaeon]